MHLDVAFVNLLGQGGIRPEQQLLSGLASTVEGALDEHAAEGAVRQQPAVLSGEGDSLGGRLVDDSRAQFGQSEDVGLTRTKITAFLGIVKKSKDRIAVILVILGRVDASLGGNAVGAPGTVLKTETLDLVTHGGQGRGGGGSGQARADHDDRVAGSIAGADQADVIEVGCPLLLDATGRNFSFQFHRVSDLPPTRR